MDKRLLFLLVMGIYFTSYHSKKCLAQNNYKAQNLKVIDKIVKSYEREMGFSGNVLISQGEKIIYKHSSGFSNYEYEIPNNLNTKFRLASLSKQFTATALVVLEEKGKVKFDIPISAYLKNLKPEIANKITIHHILSHSSGLARDIESLSEKELGFSYISLDNIIKIINKSDLQSEPGKKWSYSNLGYALAAKIIENITKLSYGEALNSLLFKPLKMLNTGHENSSDLIKYRANGYVNLPDGIINAAYEDKSYVVGAGSIYSTINDLFIWSRALIQNKLLTKKSKEKLFSKQKGRYSYGWFIDTYVWPPVNNETQAVNPHHEGGSPGFESKLSILTKHDIVVIILSNKLPSGINGLSNRITNACLGFEEAPLKANGSKEFYETLFNNGIDAAATLTKNWKENKLDHMPPKRGDIFLIGRGYMEAKNFHKAILIMDYLIKIKPKWSYPYLFKAFMMEEENKIKEAVQLYNKVLEINPNQTNAIYRLKMINK